MPPELFNALIDCKEAIDSRRTAAETLLGAFLGPDKPPSDETDHKKSKSDVCDTGALQQRLTAKHKPGRRQRPLPCPATPALPV